MNKYKTENDKNITHLLCSLATRQCQSSRQGKGIRPDPMIMQPADNAAAANARATASGAYAAANAAAAGEAAAEGTAIQAAC